MSRPESGKDVYRQRWASCNGCGCGITVTNPDGVPDDEEWDRNYSCPVCGDTLAGGFGNADPEIDLNKALADLAEARAENESLGAMADRQLAKTRAERDAARAEAKQLRDLVDSQLGECVGCNYNDGPDEFCPRHGRSYNGMVEVSQRMITEARAEIRVLAEKIGTERLVHRLQEQRLAESGSFKGAPRWDEDRIVIENGWLDGRCARCGEALPVNTASAELAAIRAAVREHHYEDAGCCVSCVDEYDNPQAWPCDTVRALAAAVPTPTEEPTALDGLMEHVGLPATEGKHWVVPFTPTEETD